MTVSATSSEMTSEKVTENPNVWTELGDGDYVAVDYGMNFHRGTLL